MIGAAAIQVMMFATLLAGEEVDLPSDKSLIHPPAKPGSTGGGRYDTVTGTVNAQKLDVEASKTQLLEPPPCRLTPTRYRGVQGVYRVRERQSIPSFPGHVYCLINDIKFCRIISAVMFSKKRGYTIPI